MPRAKKGEETNEPTSIDKLVEVVSSLAEQVKAVTEKVEAIQEKKETRAEEPVYNTIEELFPIPFEYRQIVNEVLNKSFNIEVTPLADSPSFQFTVVVPDIYSNLAPEYKAMYKRDIRPRIINNALGSAGVRQWCELVYNSFPPEVRSRIEADRIKELVEA